MVLSQFTLGILRLSYQNRRLRKIGGAFFTMFAALALDVMRTWPGGTSPHGFTCVRGKVWGERTRDREPYAPPQPAD